MLYILCPTCGYLLGTKEIKYEESMKELYKKYNIDQESVSKGILETNDNFIKDRSDIINKLCERYCCKMRFVTYLDLSQIIRP